MTSVCYWFSGTGNSLFAARRAAREFNGMRLVPITKELAEHPPALEGEAVGLVFPVYAYGPPAIVKRFVHNAAMGNVGYLFAVCTHGGGPGNAMVVLDELLTARGRPADAAFTIRMPSNYVVGSNPLTGPKLDAVLDKGAMELEEMAVILAARGSAPVSSTSLGGRFKSWAVHPLFMAGLKRGADKGFFAEERCTGCGICVKSCPMGNISLTEAGRPLWHGSCEYCLGCIHACPEQAIQKGMLTRRRGRYRHPEVPLAHLLDRHSKSS